MYFATYSSGGLCPSEDYIEKYTSTPQSFWHNYGWDWELLKQKFFIWGQNQFLNYIRGFIPSIKKSIKKKVNVDVDRDVIDDVDVNVEAAVGVDNGVDVDVDIDKIKKIGN